MNGLRPFLGSKDRVIRNRWQIRAFLADRATFPDMRKIAALFSLPFFLGVACGGSSATAPASSATASPPAASPAAGAPSKAVAAAGQGGSCAQGADPPRRVLQDPPRLEPLRHPPHL